MIGQFKIIGNDCYIQVNVNGTIEKLPKLKWYLIFYFAFKNAFLGGVCYSEVKRAVKL